MLDIFKIPGSFKSDVQVFNSTSDVNLAGLQQWNKPPSASMVMMICIAGGGGGGAGFTRAAAAAGGGGGSGASSGLARFICPAMFLPDTLYVQVGRGGQGGRPGVSSGNGSAGTNSYILTSKTAVLPNIVCYSGANAPGGGGGGATGAAGAAGTVPTIAVTQPCNTWGEWFAIVGLVGVIGGAQTGAVGGDITAWGAQVMSPGASGAGCTTTDYAGGQITATAITDLNNVYFPTGAGNVVKGGTAAGAAPNGGGGVCLMSPFFSTGGSGGGSNNSGQAGHGGNGGIGSGGGGGGAGATAGNGGNGGNGLVVIISW